MTNAALIMLIVVMVVVAVILTINWTVELSEKVAIWLNIPATIIVVLLLLVVAFNVYKDIQTHKKETRIVEEAVVEEDPMLASVPTDDLTPADIPAPANVLTDQEIEQKYNYAIILSKYGQPMNFNDHSLRMRETERYKATGFFDAVTYTDVPMDERKEEGWIESFLDDEIRSNPVYASGAFLALQELKIIGTGETASEWSQTYNLDRDEIFVWIGDLSADKLDALNDGEEVSLPLSAEYNEYSSYIAELLHGASNKGIHSTKEGWKILRQYGLDVDKEIIVESTKTDPYEFWVFEFLYKDGTKKYLGINTKDFRFLILDPPSAIPSKPAKPKPNPSPNPQPNPDPPQPNPQPTPQPGPHKNPDLRPGDHNDEPDDKGPGEFEPNEPAWPTTPTVFVGDDTSDRKPKDSDPVIAPGVEAIDENRPDYDQTPTHDTRYADVDGNVSSAESEPINDGGNTESF